MRDSAILVKNVWKIFGHRAEEALKAIKSGGLSKDDVIQKFGCVVGVSDATFDIGEGEIFCIMGLSGSGKSTLVRHINRLLEPTAGEIFVSGKDIMSLNQTELREMRARRIGMVFQNFGLLPDPVLSAIMWPCPGGAGYQPFKALRDRGRKLKARKSRGMGKTSTPMSFPAECSSASDWRERWPPIRIFCSWTNPSARSIPLSGGSCRINSWNLQK